MTKQAAKVLLGKTGQMLLSRLHTDERAAKARGDEKSAASLRIAIDEISAARAAAAKAAGIKDSSLLHSAFT